MHYLLWEPSEYDYSNESFVLLKTEASEELVKPFIQAYFRAVYQILLTSNDIRTFNEKEIGVISFTEEQIHAWYAYKQQKEDTETKQNIAEWEYLTPWRKKVQEAEQQLKALDEEERLAIYKYFEPQSVTKDTIEAMRKMGYEKCKGKNGKTRFRSIHHNKMREEFALRRQAMKEVVRILRETKSQAAKDYKAMHQIMTFEPVKYYQRD